ncbi:hypothetical protein [Pseudomonas monteilii]|uniref:hypothetical protein n=1 Tax=Pseudomonas monteilii TaxID=76759 RepID=UPI001E4A87B2|nr:hypothetical protein [Pseudomonas monteilii]MCE0925999.1 hypothetical protein [Pseudomonas monteilii]MCE0934686.1 hypothetical protein [Pseudomonas monteilii]MCE0980965.1 hypothetical protein [Pseudomonas monteilii]MCE1012268.1 hypothetical protein [Pseudomonas monteilii]MCE1040974.1 hypothetical protein [Pseudomonas monteilii]
MEIVPSKTERGFTLLEFSDLYGARCNIQLSSLAEREAIWIGVESAEPQIMASQAAAFGVQTKETVGWVRYPVPDQVLLTTRMHLSREQVAALLPVLQRFAATGEVRA